jgi:hypothetical protein
MVIVAQNLMMHGIIGKAKVRKLQRHETNETTAEFRAADYIMAARNHFGISREEAENLTMTEFLANAKYPNQKGLHARRVRHGHGRRRSPLAGDDAAGKPATNQ